MDHKNIQEAMLAIYAEVGYVQKQSSPNLKYTFAGEGALIRALRPAMIDNGVTACVIKMDDLIQSQYTAGYEGKTQMTRATIHGVVRYNHISGTYQDVEVYGEGSDSGDKSVNKAMTDLMKYAHRQTFMIETGDDPDKDAAPAATGTKVVQTQQNAVQEFAQESGAKVTELSKNDKGVMSLDFAKSVVGSDGIKYSELERGALAGIANAKAKKKKETPAEWNDADQMKLDAAKTLLTNWDKLHG